jgi:hypothetical protein
MGTTITLYEADGTPIAAREFRLKSGSRLADGLVTDDGRIIYCRDEQKGLFFYDDSRKELYLRKPQQTQS